MKQRIKLTESALHRIIKESVKSVLSEDFINDGEWKYQGTKVDKYMWALKKDAEKKNQTREDGWPSVQYLQNWYDYATNEVDSDLSEFDINYDDYSLSSLWSAVDSFLYLRSLRQSDVLGRPTFRRHYRWF